MALPAGDPAHPGSAFRDQEDGPEKPDPWGRGVDFVPRENFSRHYVKNLGSALTVAGFRAA
jgi:hypothetical protein